MYLAVVVDAWSRRVVGWSIADHLRSELVVDALDMAIRAFRGLRARVKQAHANIQWAPPSGPSLIPIQPIATRADKPLCARTPTPSSVLDPHIVSYSWLRSEHGHRGGVMSPMRSFAGSRMGGLWSWRCLLNLLRSPGRVS